MMRIQSHSFESTDRGGGLRPALPVLLLAACIIAAVTPSAQASGALDRAKNYFEEARKKHSELQKTSMSNRTIEDYSKLIDTFRRVYLTAPTYGNSTISLMAIGELSEEMARRWSEPNHFQQAIEAYSFLLREYPQSQFRFDARLAIARIYRHDLHQPEKALEQFGRYVADYPNSAQSKLARQAVSQLRDEIGPTADAAENHANTVSQTKEGTLSSKLPAIKPVAGKPASESPSSGKAAKDDLSTITDIRYWTNPESSRVVVDVGQLGVGQKLKYQAAQLSTPPRLYIDLQDTRIPQPVGGRTLEVNGDLLKRVRLAQFDKRVSRLVLDLGADTDFQISEMTNPYRLVIDVRGRVSEIDAAIPVAANSPTPTLPSVPAIMAKVEMPAPVAAVRTAIPIPAISPVRVKDEGKTLAPATNPNAKPTVANQSSVAGTATAHSPAPSPAKDSSLLKAEPAKTPTTIAAQVSAEPKVDVTASPAQSPLEQQPLPALKHDLTVTHVETKTAEPAFVVTPPMMAHEPASAATAATTPAPAPIVALMVAPNVSKAEKDEPPVDAAPVLIAKAEPAPVAPSAADQKLRAAAPIRGGTHSLTRALGLKIGRIFIDAGHGGHDTGTIGPGGLTEKELALDLAQRVGRMIEEKLGSEVVFSRDDDSFVPLESRVALANKAEADLFLSIHLNSSTAKNAVGIETYYLNFTSDPEALKVAARENSGAQETIANLQGIVRKIALQEKLDESKEFAARMQSSLRKSLAKGMNRKAANQFDRGVKTAPFVVLIGANMPSVLAEVSFLSNPAEEKRLRTTEHRQKIAEALFAGVSGYVDTLSGVKVAPRLPAPGNKKSPAKAESLTPLKTPKTEDLAARR